MPATTSVGDNLLEQLLAASTRTVGCSVCIFIDAQPDRETWPAVMAHPKISTRVIHAELARRGYDHTESPVKVHRMKHEPR